MNFPIRIGVSPSLKIRGVVATSKIKRGEVIEKCPVILVRQKEEADLDKTILGRYYFEYSKAYVCIGLGYASLYNHSYTPNADLVYDYRNQQLIFKARENIACGEEITFNYNGEAHSKKKLDQYYTDFDPHRRT